ncbi:class I SAM-dependent methyltransferase, partial [Rhizobium ruizarguesonis]
RHANLSNGFSVLDIAEGTGEPGLTAAAAIPDSQVVVTDLSENTLTAAAENAARSGLKNFKTQLCDAGALLFADASFDAVLCRFGFM